MSSIIKSIATLKEDTNNELEVQYTLTGRGTETIRENDKLLTTTESVKARAESMFLAQSYKHSIINITTPHINGLEIGFIIQLDNVLYKIIALAFRVSGAVREVNMTIQRWD